VGKLDVLSILSRATGVFGEDTLHSLSRKLEEEGTEFERLSATLKLRDGTLTSGDLALVSPDLDLKGDATVDLLQATIDGQFQVVFSEELSRSMREEDSRAAQVFWDSRARQVNLPLGLAGPFDAPAASIDWGTAAKRAATGKVEDELRRRLGGLLGGGDEEPEKEELAGKESATQRESLAAGGADDAAGAAELPASPTVRIRAAGWSRSLLQRDLEIEGKVRGTNLVRAELVVTDAEGREVERVELREIDRHFRRTGADRAERATIAWEVTVEGKRLMGATAPFTIRVDVFDSTGASASATREVEK
jgi:hypothetical protein